MRARELGLMMAVAIGGVLAGCGSPATDTDQPVAVVKKTPPTAPPAAKPEDKPAVDTGKPAAGAPARGAGVIGTWVPDFSKMPPLPKTLPPSTLAEFKKANMELAADGTFKMNSMGMSLPGTYKLDGNKLSIKVKGATNTQVAEYDAKAQTITLGTGAQRGVFIRAKK